MIPYPFRMETSEDGEPWTPRMDGRYRRDEDQLGAVANTPGSDDPPQLLEDAGSCRIQIEDPVDQGDVDRTVGKRQVLCRGPSKENVAGLGGADGTASTQEHGFAEIDANDPSSRPYASCRDQRVQARATTEIQHRGARCERRRNRDVRYAREGLNDDTGELSKCGRRSRSRETVKSAPASARCQRVRSRHVEENRVLEIPHVVEDAVEVNVHFRIPFFASPEAETVVLEACGSTHCGSAHHGEREMRSSATGPSLSTAPSSHIHAAAPACCFHLSALTPFAMNHRHSTTSAA